MAQQRRDLARQKRTKIRWSDLNFTKDLGSPVNQGDYVLQIMAAEMVAATAPIPGLQLRRHQVERRDRPVIAEAVGPQALFEPIPGHPRSNLDDEVYILRHPRLGRALIGDPERDRGAANESDFIEERVQLLRGPLARATA